MSHFNDVTWSKKALVTSWAEQRAPPALTAPPAIEPPFPILLICIGNHVLASTIIIKD